MFTFTASLESGDAARNLDQILARNLSKASFEPCIQRLRRLSSAASSFYPPPWPAPMLAVTPEINCQSELWLPLAEVRPVFERFFRLCLNYPPILSSTPFATAASWAALASGLPPFAARLAAPTKLLERLITDDDFRLKFLCWAFMPPRFYGAGARYPGQTAWIASWLEKRGSSKKKLRCLDAACGVGFSTYGLARLLAEQGWQAEGFCIEGWTLDPLEAWAAAHAMLPHDAAMEKLLRLEFLSLDGSLTFSAVDLLEPPDEVAEKFDLILCNGLLGGPIINASNDLKLAVGLLTQLLAPGGVLLVADHFHGGWKKKCPQDELRAMIEQQGLKLLDLPEGIGASLTGA